jgi:hypothetical protein
LERTSRWISCVGFGRQRPETVVVDSFRTVAHASGSEAKLQEFAQRLALHLTGWQATKMRTSRRDRRVRRDAIEPSGIIVGEPLRGHAGILTGVPLVRAEGVATPGGSMHEYPVGLTGEEAALLEDLRELAVADAHALSRRSGLKGTALSTALARLRQLDHIAASRRKGIAFYRVTTPTDG